MSDQGILQREQEGRSRLGSARGLLVGRDALLVVVAVVGYGAFVLMQYWDTWAIDLSAYYYAGHFFHLGQFDQVYAGPPEIIGPEIPPAWAAALASDGHASERTYPFLYLPWVAAAMAPVAAAFEPVAVMRVVLVLNIALVLASAGLAFRIMAPGRITLGPWMAVSVGVFLASATVTIPLYLGQMQILVFALVLFTFERLQRGRPAQAGLALALAAALKITPAAFAIVFLWNREWRALAVFLAAITVGGAAMVLGIGWELHAQFFDLLGRLNARLFLSNMGVSAEGFVFQVTELLQGTAPVYLVTEHNFAKPDWQDLVVKAGFVIGLGLIWARTRGRARRARIADQMLALGLLVPLMTPLGWVHYYLVATFALPIFLDSKGNGHRLAFVAYALMFSQIALLELFGPGQRFMVQYIAGVPLVVTLLGLVLAGPIAGRGVKAAQ